MDPLDWNATNAIARLEQTNDLGQRYYAAWWLGQFRVRDREAIAALLVALTDTHDRSPDGGYPLRRNAARAIAKLGNCDPRLVPELVVQLACPDYYVREEAARTLGFLGDRGCLPDLLALIDGGPAAAIPVPDKPHLRQPYEAVLKALGRLGAQGAIEDIRAFCTHEVPKVRFAAGAAIYQLEGDAAYLNPVLAGLEADNLALRRSALLTLGDLGYLPAAETIFDTEAENSLKLIAMKGLLEQSLQEEPGNPLTERNRRLMELMDGLL